MTEAATSGTAAATGGTSWTAGLDAELVGHAQTKGWADKPVADVAKDILKAHREAEKLIGVPANKLLRLPDATDADGNARMWGQLGKPADAKDYDFSGVKPAQGEIDAKMVEDFRKTAFAANLTKDAARSILVEQVKRMDAIAAEAAAVRGGALETERANLKQNWGPNFDANMLVAKNAATKLGFKPETVAALESVAGYAAVMDMFRTIGASIGEDKFVQSGDSTKPGVMTRDQAIARKAELMGDKEWGKRYMAGDTAANREMTALITIIAGDDTEFSRRR